MSLDKFFKFFTPKENTFYQLFEEDADNLVKIAQLLSKLMHCQVSSEWSPIIKEIKDLEVVGDAITNRIYDHLDKSFITPFDREEIYALATCIDDIADSINAACNRVKMYKPKVFIPEFTPLATLILEAARLIKRAIEELKDVSSSQTVTELCQEISKIEHLADELYHIAISKLFEKETDPIELIKIKDVLETLEGATDHAKSLSDVLKTVVIKRT
ncbi:conserved hypothetical protein [uncultured Desulfobacterium sp.]|uniref:Phosphate transport regulator n=1 Tax=uncultured Desulfobacterium sp. TaxID=201089 RepID=A0A445N193_9BACT|nr:conserved hypothetical protein [uncultured Desulfobacterium sp.]